MDKNLFEQQMQITMTNVLYKRGIINMNQRDEVCRLILQSFESRDKILVDTRTNSEALP